MILVGTDGFTTVEAEAKLEAIFKIAREQGSTQTTAMSRDEFQGFMGFRDDQSVGDEKTPIQELGLFPLFGGVMDGPLDAMVPCMEAAGQMINEVCAQVPDLYGVRIGHIGAGTFHPVFFAPDSWEFDKLQSLAKELRARMLALQLEFGCTTGEQGILHKHYEWFHKYYGPEYTNLVSRIRSALDPLNLVNQERFARPTFNG